MSQPGTSKPSKQQPKANSHHGNRAQSPPFSDWDCFKKPFTSNLCKIIAQLRPALSQQAPDLSFQFKPPPISPRRQQFPIEPQSIQEGSTDTGQAESTSAPCSPTAALCPLSLPPEAAQPLQGLHGGLSQPKCSEKLWEQQLSMATHHPGES